MRPIIDAMVRPLAADEAIGTDGHPVEVEQFIAGGPLMGRFAVRPDAGCTQCGGTGRGTLVVRTKTDKRTTEERRADEACLCVRARMARFVHDHQPRPPAPPPRPPRAPFVDPALPAEIARLERIVAEREALIAAERAAIEAKTGAIAARLAPLQERRAQLAVTATAAIALTADLRADALLVVEAARAAADKLLADAAAQAADLRAAEATARAQADAAHLEAEEVARWLDAGAAIIAPLAAPHEAQIDRLEHGRLAGLVSKPGSPPA